MQAFNTKFDILCLSETYLNSSISTEEKPVIIDGYKLLSADHPSDTKRGGVCFYHNCFQMFLNKFEKLPARITKKDLILL